MTYRHNNTPRPANADVIAAFADWLRDNPGDWPVVIRGDECDVDGTDARYEATQVSDAEATYYERQRGIAS